ncbi:MAG TPA: Ig-like domain-containing protein, partial [Candidatus Polarisedimenticolia bacterium]|nr:Ig-like domain-containing protein [Candidatus Polarisedimenticolia bacterium]
NDSEFTVTNYTLVLRDITLNDSTSRFIRDYPFMTNVTADGKGIAVDAAPQGTLLDTVAVRNVTSPPGGQGGSTGFGLGLLDGNFLIGPSVTLTNNTYPIQIYSAGILPGSRLPATGNINNLIYVPGQDHAGSSTIWADAGLPYFIAEHYAQRGGSLKILDGARVRVASGAGMASDPGYVAVYGTEERPVTFDQADPGEPWFPLQLFYRIRHAVIDGATTGAAWPSSKGWGFLDSSIVRNCSGFGVIGSGIVKKTLFQNNATGASVQFNQIDLNGNTNPNAFEGNTVGVSAAGNARYNWWGSPTGPTVADNPGGTGDPVAAGVPYLPFRTVRPDFNDAPPIVQLEPHALLARPGEKLILTWKARDDGAIVSQRVILSMDGDIVQGNLVEAPIVLAGNLPGTRRSIEFTMPEPGSRWFGSSNIRVESTDDAGQIGWDDLHIYAEADEPGQLVLASPLAAVVTAGADLGPVCWQAQQINPIGGMVDAHLLLENTGEYISLGGVTTYLNCLSGSLTAPFVSTDRARIVLSLFTGGGVSQPEYYFGPAFAIRPDSRVQDAPPTVVMTSPAPGATVPGGTTLPIRWIAGDDVSVRVVHIQVSTDGGRTWSFIARDLPGNPGAYDWQVPPSAGGRDVRVKVVAVDEHFQDSSDGGAVASLPAPVTGLAFTDST